jgi:hypothetical protein
MKKYLLFLMVFSSLVASAQTVYYTQDFESGFPADWMMTGQWEIGTNTTISSQYFAPAAHTTFMGINDDALGNGVVGKGRVTTGPIDLTAATGNLVLYFDSYFINGDYQGANETSKISVSTDAGATWTEIYNLEISGAWQEVGVLLGDAYSGQTIQLAFDYDDGNGWNYGWCFDNVKLSSPSVVRDAAVEYLNEESFVSGALPGAVVYPGLGIKNNGVETITSLDLVWTDGTNTNTETITGLDIAFGATALFKSTTPYIMGNSNANITVSVKNINGMGADEAVDNDGDSFSLTVVTPNADKAVVVEEATGTWCQWCPRGAVFLDLMTRRFGEHFVGIAVHNNDPMVLAAYDTGLGITSFPSVKLNRVSTLDPSEIEGPFLADVVNAPPAKLSVGATYDDATRLLQVSVGADFAQDLGAGYKLNAVIIEDDVTGTGTSYNQINAYSGGGPGPMGGYEVLPSSVPAAQMVYDHVGRALLGGFGGAAGSLPDAITAGKVVGYFFPDYTIPGSYDADNIHIVAMLINPTGQIVNAKSVSIADAVANGPFVSSTKETINNDLINISPNPFSSTANVSLTLEASSEVSMRVFDAVGKLVQEKNFGQVSGTQTLKVDGKELENGMYFIQVRVNDTIATKRVVLEK